MLRRSIPLAIALALAPSVASAQVGSLVASNRFAGCDALYCTDVTFLTYASTDPSVAPYFLSMRGQVSAQPTFFATTNAGFDGAYFVSPDPGFPSDWMDGFGFFVPLSLGTPTATFDFSGFGWFRTEAPEVTAARVRYWAFLNPGDTFQDFGGFDLAPVSTVPEPTTAALLAGGVVALALVRRRRRR